MEVGNSYLCLFNLPRGEDTMSSRTIRVSVRNLIEFVLRSGDLDNRTAGFAEKDAMQAGNRIHKKIQRSMGSSYQKEVALKHTIDEQEFHLTIEGRADGIIVESDQVIIDEIKGIYRDLSYIEEPYSIHLAQAQCYGYIYALQNEKDTITLQITYCNLETEEIKRFQEEKTMVEMEQWFQGLIHEYIKWARYLYQHGLRRDESLAELTFPFPYRAGQKELAVSVYKAIVRKKNLFIQAPTGIGKTLSTIYPSLKAIQQGYGDKLFYLTAKTMARSVAEESFRILHQHGMYLRTVTITAKEKLCFIGKPDCNPDACPYAKGHFDRINEAVYEIIHHEFSMTKDVMLEYAERFQVCPFEFCLDISNWVDAVICDYNYVFHPTVQLKRYFAEGTEGNYLFLIDEAHNLVSRAREMYSAQLVKEDFLEMKRLMQHKNQKISKLLNKGNQYLLELKRECTQYQIVTEIHHIVINVMTLVGEIESFLSDKPQFEAREQLLDFYFNLKYFLNIFEGTDECYQFYTELRADGSFLLRLFCINPSKMIKKNIDKGNNAVFFSATLLPIIYYKELLSGNTDDYAVYTESPFAKENRLLLIAGDVSSRYTRRNEREYKKITAYIIQAVSQKVGNYIVFFPSYYYLQQVEAILKESPQFLLHVQQSNMNEQEKDEYLAYFSQTHQKPLVALCVMGGIFSEGIDLKGEQLIGVIIVGPGIPMISTEQEILRAYFEEKEQKGFEFAYQYPGMNKVMQAAGRVIRTMEDRGIILLLDDRFLQDEYQNLFPREWDQFVPVNQRNISLAVNDFWNAKDKKLP